VRRVCAEYGGGGVAGERGRRGWAQEGVSCVEDGGKKDEVEGCGEGGTGELG
jgi:hypothetical protein